MSKGISTTETSGMANKGKCRTIHISMPCALAEKLEKLARDNGDSLSYAVRSLIRRVVK